MAKFRIFRDLQHHRHLVGITCLFAGKNPPQLPSEQPSKDKQKVGRARHEKLGGSQAMERAALARTETVARSSAFGAATGGTSTDNGRAKQASRGNRTRTAHSGAAAARVRDRDTATARPPCCSLV